MDNNPGLGNADFQRMLKSLQNGSPIPSEGVDLLRGIAEKAKASSLFFAKVVSPVTDKVVDLEEKPKTEKSFTDQLAESRAGFLYLVYMISKNKSVFPEGKRSLTSEEKTSIEGAIKNLHELSNSEEGRAFFKEIPYFFTFYDREFYKKLREAEELHFSRI